MSRYKSKNKNTISNKNKCNKGYKYRIYPTESQKTLIEKTFGCARLVYNLMLSDKIEHYKETKQNLDVHPAQYKEQYPFLCEVDSLALCNSEMNLKTAYKNFFDKKSKSKFPKFKKKKNSGNKSYTTNYVNNNITLDYETNHIKLPKLGLVKIKLHRKLPENSKIKNVTVSHTSSGKYYVSICVEYECSPVSVSKNNDTLDTMETIPSAVGLDYSSKDFFIGIDTTTSSSSIISTDDTYLHLYRKSEDKLKKLQKKLSKKKLYSSNWKKANKRVSRIHEKIKNQRNDYLHKLSHQLTGMYDVICLETLDMQNISQSLNLGKSTMDNGFGMFQSMLEYKAKENNSTIIYVDKWFPSSKMCHVCDNVLDTLSLSTREWKCPHCHSKHDRDINAATNILNEGLKLFYQY